MAHFALIRNGVTLWGAVVLVNARNSSVSLASKETAFLKQEKACVDTDKDG